MPTLSLPLLALSLTTAPPTLADGLSFEMPVLQQRAAPASAEGAWVPAGSNEVAEDLPPDRPHTAVRLAAEAGGALTVGFAGMAVGAAVGSSTCGRDDGFDCMDNVGMGALIGAVLGGATGTTLGGHLAGGNGNFIASLLGGVAGGLTLGLLTAGTEAQGTAVALGAMAGHLAGYELTDSAPTR
ncbi:hypothetical protein [Vulgatibacter sp.]|uniref:hypothetical protein n=1 Tax=Vulgatibacter sp. TaxID=1971226 RepID=UPI0035694ADC